MWDNAEKNGFIVKGRDNENTGRNCDGECGGARDVGGGFRSGFAR